MTTSKRQYLELVRANSTYPTYRGFIGTIALLGSVLAAVTGLATLIAGLASMKTSFPLGCCILVAGFIWSALIYLLARFFKEASLILADMGDATLETNSRNS